MKEMVMQIRLIQAAYVCACSDGLLTTMTQQLIVTNQQPINLLK